MLPDAGIFDALTLLQLVEHWEGQIHELDAAMKRVEQSNLEGIREELDLYRRIRATFAGILEVLGDMNTRTRGAQRDAGFEDMLRAIEARLTE